MQIHSCRIPLLMSSNSFPRCLLVLICLITSLHTSKVDASKITTPNIVMIISDDQTYRDFGFMGNDEVQTPHIDKLAKSSARYVNGYVPTSVCSPSLATLLTGLYPHQSGIHYNHPPPGNSQFNKMKSRQEYERVRSKSFQLIKSVDTLPRLLATRGYRCLQTGKFWEGHYRNAGFTEGMTIFKPVPNQTFGGNRTLANGELVAHGNGDFGLKIGRETMQPIYRFIKNCEKKSTSWFVWYAPYLPHQPHDSPKQYLDLYQNQTNLKETKIAYYASCSQFDDTVGKLVSFVEQNSSLKNTLFVFVIDNGWSPGDKRMKYPGNYAHTKKSKRSPFEDGLRTPVLLRWEGVIKPATHTELVSSVDIVPTLLQAAGVTKKTNRLPGINLLPSAKGDQTLKKDRPVFGEIYPGDATVLQNPKQDLAHRWVRKGNLKLITTHNLNAKGKGWNNYLSGDALFDVVADPQEQKNLIHSPFYKEKVAKLQTILDHWWKVD